MEHNRTRLLVLIALHEIIVTVYIVAIAFIAKNALSQRPHGPPKGKPRAANCSTQTVNTNAIHSIDHCMGCILTALTGKPYLQ